MPAGWTGLHRCTLLKATAIWSACAAAWRGTRPTRRSRPSVCATRTTSASIRCFDATAGVGNRVVPLRLRRHACASRSRPRVVVRRILRRRGACRVQARECTTVLVRACAACPVAAVSLQEATWTAQQLLGPSVRTQALTRSAAAAISKQEAAGQANSKAQLRPISFV